MTPAYTHFRAVQIAIRQKDVEWLQMALATDSCGRCPGKDACRCKALAKEVKKQIRVSELAEGRIKTR